MIKKFSPILIALLLTSCIGSMNLWEETKTASRYVNRKGQSLFREIQDSKLVSSSREFYANRDDDFVPLRDEDLDHRGSFIETTIPQSRFSPGGDRGEIPGIDSFRSPSAALQDVFRTIHFRTDQHTLMNTEQEIWVEKMANYLKKHPFTYIFVAGHCDERASESYNLSLGMRRANHIRNLLIKHGAKQDQVHTISYGKEKPCDRSHTQEAWAKNRRVEFKLYDKQTG
jgi:peptidoglycan-associated lipoprotein